MSHTPRIYCFSFLLYLSFLDYLRLSSGDVQTNIVIVGATGDLSRKYLWQASLSLAQDITRKHGKVKFYGAGRLPFPEGQDLLQHILNLNVSYEKSNGFQHEFIDSVAYRQLKTRENYFDLCRDIELDVNQSNLRELGRIFYLAVPSFAYVDISKHIASECRPSNNETWLRVVFEKPFGSDLQSAQDLITKLSDNLLESEIYMTDHYFGKTGVQHILPFRKINQRGYEMLWNNDQIERVDIVLKETSDVKGRFDYYNKYGVIRDVMQNHMTEIMALLTMEVPKNISSNTEIQQRRLHVLKQVETILEDQVVVAQYKSYNQQLLSENVYNHSLIPTFATALLFINNPRWKGVPFFLLSGKKLDQRISYARILFKQNSIRGRGFQESSYQSKEMIFLINSNSTPSIYVSTLLPKPNCPYGEASMIRDADNILGRSPSNYYYYSCHPKHNMQAYNTLLSAVYYGQKDLFVSTEELLLLWKIWTGVLNSLENAHPRLYGHANESDENGPDDLLNIVRTNRKLAFASDGIRDNKVEQEEALKAPKVRRAANVLFRNSSLVTGTLSAVVNSLMSDLTMEAVENIKIRGIFHLAFSGGTTPLPLFNHLVLHAVNFPWAQTHIWMVDDRCVDFRQSNQSNLKVLDDNLLKFIPIPPANIHPIPSELCQQIIYNKYKLGSHVYESELLKYARKLDFIILGLGTDGHTASLFPHDYVNLQNSHHKVISTEKGPKNFFNKRISLSLEAINEARKRAVLVTGNSKRDIISIIRNGIDDIHSLPITGLRSSETTWYVDSDALGSH